MSEPRKHHYVPRLLLKNFAVDRKSPTPQTHVFDKSTSKSFKTSIYNICSERDFYKFKIEEHDLSAEHIIGSIETEAAPAIKILLDRQNLRALDEAQERALLAFVALQQTRSVGSRARYDAIATFAERRFPQLKPATPATQYKKLQAIKLSFNLIARQIISFEQKTRILFRNTTGIPFIIGDEPFVLHNGRDTGPYGNLGIACLGIEIYMPLSPDLLLGLWCPSHRHVIAEGVLKYRQLQSFAALGTPEVRSLAIKEIESGKEASKRLEERLDAIDSGECLCVDAKNVEFFNSLQVIYAERHLMSPDNDFSLPKRMIASREIYRKGARYDIA